MEIEEYLKSIGINKAGNQSDNGAYVIDLGSSDEYGKIFSKLENNEDLIIMQENQVVTVQGSSLLYEDEEEQLLLNLIADFDTDRYQLIVNRI